MPRIQLLPDPVINRIAAGEVVERPSSVVKELVENALDAGAGRVDVHLSQGGRSAVKVTDDGAGMDGDDALLALERHATSKITTADDLDHIATLGFRGEALPSIAAVSRFTLTTASDPAEGGVRVTVEGGRILAVDPVPRPRGTTVEVRDLFFNTPARRKFLRTPETELRHVQEALHAAALARTDVAFSLGHGSRTLLEVVATADPAERLRGLWPRCGRVHRFESGGGGVRAWGMIAPGSGSGRPVLTLLVNGRAVKDRLLVGAVRKVLQQAGAGFGGSRVALFLELDSGDVDVNVHPAKAEVRFARAGAVFGVVERAVRGGVEASQGRVDVRRVETSGSAGEPTERAYGELHGSRSRDREGPLFAHPAYGASEVADGSRDADGPVSAPAPPSTRPHPSGPGPRPGPADTPFGRLIGQYRDSFLVLEDDRGLVIVDQHVAHERVLYERILARIGSSNAPAQGLLEPVLLELGEAAAAALERVQGLLAAAGIEADRFGHETVRVTTLPPEVSADDAAELVEDLLDRATRMEGVPERVTQQLAEELAASMSCRGAIKVNHGLAPAAQRALLSDLGRTSNPYRCPHGRPIVLRLSQEEMERRLGRR